MPGEPLPYSFGKYTLTDRIASGGMAEVYRAKLFGVAGFEKTVAIKRILAHFAEDDGFVDMFVREANIAVKLSHSNVVQVFELGRVGDDYYIALEFVEGRDLKSLVKKSAERAIPLPVDLVAWIAQKICAGLHHAHSATDESGASLGIVHRDVSPHNVLLSWGGEVKVADFGIAKLASGVRHTRTGMIKGKLAYMSPEQSEGDPDLDGRSDIFAAGIVLYELLTGTKPFDGATDRELLRSIRETPTPLASAKRPDVPRDLDAVITKALAKKREDRFQDGASMARALGAFLQRFGSVTGRVMEEQELATMMRTLFGPRPTTPTPAARASGGTPILPPGSLDGPEMAPRGPGAVALGDGLTSMPPPGLLPPSGEVFAAAAQALSQDDSTGTPAPAARPATPPKTDPLADRRDRSTSHATLPKKLVADFATATARSPQARGALLLAVGVVAGVALVAGGYFLATVGPAGSHATPTPAPVRSHVEISAQTPAIAASPIASNAAAPTPAAGTPAPAAVYAGSVVVKGTPAGATLVIDGKTPAHLGERIAGLAAGDHFVVAQAKWYRTRRIPFRITGTAPDAAPTVSLVHEQGTLRVGHGKDNQYRVEIPGVVPKGQELEKNFDPAPAGRYTATITAAAKQWKVIVVVLDGQTTKMLLPDDTKELDARQSTGKEFGPGS